MYIKYELYRAKNPDECFNREMIEWVLETDKDIIELDKRMNDVLAQHIQGLPEVQKFGIAYVGRMKIVGIEINDNDYTCELDKENFINYVHSIDVMPYLDVIWNKTDKKEDKEEDADASNT